MFDYYQFGAYDDNRCARFSVFFPGSPGYSHGGDPKIKELKVFGTFQAALGQAAWSEANALKLEPGAFENGTLYQAKTSTLPEGFYEYKYIVTFDDDRRRIVGDPCARYGSGKHENSGFVIGGSQPSDNVVAPLTNRLEPRDLIIYEMMIEDFTKEYFNNQAPIDAVIDRLDYIRDLGFNAIEFMPWTAWPGNEFSWGYNPFMYFAVEYRYVDHPLEPAEKLSRLKRLISECHKRELHVIMDGVFNHVEKGSEGFGFAYYWLYKNAADCPFIGQFGEGGFSDEIDFHNQCAAQFILDVCRYWIDVFGIDGLRLDYTKGFYLGGNSSLGLPDLIDGIRKHIAKNGDDFKRKFPIFIEHLNGYQAIDVANKVNATGCWYDEMIWRTRDYLYHGHIDERIMRLLNTARDFGPDRVPVTYIENHDHSEIAAVAGGAFKCQFNRDQWYRAQPYLIALLTCSGAPLLYNGQEFADGYAMPEGYEEEWPCIRVQPRPKHWARSEDSTGSWMRYLVQKLIRIRKEHPALKSANFYPSNWDESWMRKPDGNGYGVDVEKGTVVYHRWGHASDGQFERFIIVLNFSQWTQTIDIPLPGGGLWEDLISGWRVTPTAGDKLRQQIVSSNWGFIFYKKG